jgi:hypothetical protein
MSKRILLAIFAVTALLAGCTFPRLSGVMGSGRPVTRDYPITDFSRVEVQNAFDATIRQGDEFKVSVTVDDNLLDYLVVDKVGDTLVIRFDNRNAVSFRSNNQAAAITLPKLEGVKASGASAVRLMDVTSDGRFDAELSGASRLTGVLDAPELRLEESGASNALLNGTVPKVDLALSGASTSDLSHVLAQALSARVSGASSATVNASESLDFDLSGASTLRYLGEPSISLQNVSGGSRAVALP